MSLNVSETLLFVGIDWAADTHAVCVQDVTGKQIAAFTVEHTAAGLAGLTGRRSTHGDPSTVHHRRFALQSAIAAVHAEAPSYPQTDWPQLLGLYDALLRTWPSPVVALNRAVAVAMVHGPEAGLTAVVDAERDGRLAGHRYAPATRADLLRRLDRRAEAAVAYREALSLTDNQTEREFLQSRITDLGVPG